MTADSENRRACALFGSRLQIIFYSELYLCAVLLCCLSRCDLRSPGMLLSWKVGQLWSLSLVIDCCSNRIRLAFDLYINIYVDRK